MRKEIEPATIYSDGTYLDLNRGWHTEDSPYKASNIIKMIEENGISIKSCADVGCGAGLVTEILASRYPSTDFVGFELSKDACELQSQRRKMNNLKYSNANLIDLDEKYNLVICSDVLEHVEDYFGFLRMLRTKGEKFIFNIPLDMNALKILTSGIKYARANVGHLHYFNEYTAIETLKDCGYTIKSAKLCVAYLSIPPRNIKQFLVLPLRIFSLAFGKRFAAMLAGGGSLLVYAD